MRFKDFQAVESLIQNRIPESGSLEYKSELSLASDGNRKELLKDLTGMGNGGGGTIIFGMQEEPGTSVAKELSPLIVVTTGQIEDIVRSAVHPPLVWSFTSFEVAGVVIVADVAPRPWDPT